MPQFDWLCDVCGCVMSPTSGIYWVELGFINNCKEPQLWLVLLRDNAYVASAFPWVVTDTDTDSIAYFFSFFFVAFIIFLFLAHILALYIWFETLGCILRTSFTFMLYLRYVLKLQTFGNFVPFCYSWKLCAWIVPWVVPLVFLLHLPIPWSSLSIPNYS